MGYKSQALFRDWQRERRDREVMEATFKAIAAAMRWNVQCPHAELTDAMRAHLDDNVAHEAVARLDEELAAKLIDLEGDNG